MSIIISGHLLVASFLLFGALQVDTLPTTTVGPLTVKLNVSTAIIRPGRNGSLVCQVANLVLVNNSDYFKVYFKGRTHGTVATYFYDPTLRICLGPNGSEFCPFMKFYPNTSDPSVRIGESRTARWMPAFEITLTAVNQTVVDHFHCEVEHGGSKVKSAEVNLSNGGRALSPFSHVTILSFTFSLLLLLGHLHTQ